MVDRKLMITVKVSEDEHAMMAALADSHGEDMSTTVRRWIRSFYKERFGTQAPRERKGAAR